MKRPVETLEDLMLLEQMDDLEDESNEADGVMYAADEELGSSRKSASVTVNRAPASRGHVTLSRGDGEESQDA